MRIGASILLIDGYCYQSYSWNKFRPLGELQSIIDSLESYQCDEIVIVRPIRQNSSLESFTKDIKIIENIKSMTPLSFGGGLRDIKNIDLLHNLPIERLIFSSSFIDKEFDVIKYATKLYGHQAIQCVLPFRIENNNLEVFSSSKDKFISADKIDFAMIDNLANEIILLDTINEGTDNSFDINIFNHININMEKLIISGGISKKIINYSKEKKVASVIIENKVLHSEYSIKGYKNV